MLRGGTIFLALAFSALGVAQTCVTPPPDLVAWWPLDELSGTVAADIVGGRDGMHDSWMGDPLPGPVTGIVSGALRFGGLTALNTVRVPHDPVFNFGLTQDFTIDCWIRADPEPGVYIHMIICKLNPGPSDYDVPYGWELYLYNGYLAFQMRSNHHTGTLPFHTIGTACVHSGSGCAALDDSRWHLIAVTVDRDRSPDGGTLYVDGARVLTFDPTPLLVSADNTDDLRIGQSTPCFCIPAAPTFNGDIDEVEIFNRELSAAEILAIHAAGAAGKCKIPLVITSPASGSAVTGAVPIIFDVTPLRTPATATLSFDGSRDGGVTWSSASPTAGSPLANPSPGTTLPLVGARFDWDSVSDGVGAGGPEQVIFRVTASDPTASSSATVTLDVDNSAPSCPGICGDCNVNSVGPDIVDALVSAQLAASITTPTPTQSLCCDVNSSGTLDVIDSLLIAQDAAGLAPGLVCP